MTLQEHLEQNRAQILAEAKIYAKSYNVSLEEAIRDVRDEYAQGYHDDTQFIREQC